MKRPPTSFALVFVLAACLDRSSALAKAADARPREGEPREMRPLEASGPEAHDELWRRGLGP